MCPGESGSAPCNGGKLVFLRIRPTLEPLRRPPFSRLLLAYFVSYLGDLVGLIALSVLVFDETESALAVSALFIATQFLPAIGAPALTARIDQLALRRVLPAIYLLEAIIFGVLALLADRFSLVLILVLALADGVLMLTARGLTRAAVSATLEPVGLLRQGNGILNVAFALASAGGAALGGFIVQEWQPSGALLVDAASFLIVGCLLVTATHLPQASEAREPFRHHFREGLVRLRRDRRTGLLVAGEALAVLFFALVVPIEVVYAKETLEVSDAEFGILLSSWGVGIVLGSIFFLRLRQVRLGPLIFAATAAIGVAYLGMSAVTTLAAACAFSVVGGIGNGIQWVAVMTALQESTPANMQARMTGLLESATSFTTGLGFLLGGVVAALTSAPTAYAVSGAGVAVLLVFGALLLRRAAPAPPPATAPSDSDLSVAPFEEPVHPFRRSGTPVE
jgi:predicted MFS family arabinose efflux permease